MIRKSQQVLLELGAGCVVLLIAAVLEPGLARMGLTLLYGLIWLALACKTGLSPLLVSALTLLAVRLPPTADLPMSARWAACLGLGAWTLTVWSKHRLSAVSAGLLWGGAAVCLPALWPLALLGFPRLGKVYGDGAKWARTPGILLLAAGLLALSFRYAVPDAFTRVVNAEHYADWLASFEGLFTRERLWLMLPLAGGFEVAQGQPEDLRLTWRNLVVPGFLLSLLWMSPATAPGLLYWVAPPLCSIMLTRWTYALPGWPPRVAMWLGLAMFAWPILAGGAV